MIGLPVGYVPRLWHGFALAAGLLALALAVQTWRLGHSQETVAQLESALKVERTANQRLAGEVDALAAKFSGLQSQLADANTKAADAVAALAENQKRAERDLSAERDRLRRLYARSPEARVWSAQALPEGVAEALGDD